MQFVVTEVTELRSVAKSLLESIGNTKIVAFHGHMGSGKTTFIQFILAAMGIEDGEGSPTYSIVNEYISPMYGKVFHFDLYRIESEEEAYDIGIEEMLYGEGICFIEWPERIEELLPEDVLNVRIDVNSDLFRIISWEEPDKTI